MIWNTKKFAKEVLDQHEAVYRNMIDYISEAFANIEYFQKRGKKDAPQLVKDLLFVPFYGLDGFTEIFRKTIVNNPTRYSIISDHPKFKNYCECKYERKIQFETFNYYGDLMMDTFLELGYPITLKQALGLGPYPIPKTWDYFRDDGLIRHIANCLSISIVMELLGDYKPHSPNFRDGFRFACCNFLKKYYDMISKLSLEDWNRVSNEGSYDIAEYNKYVSDQRLTNSEPVNAYRWRDLVRDQRMEIDEFKHTTLIKNAVSRLQTLYYFYFKCCSKGFCDRGRW